MQGNGLISDKMILYMYEKLEFQIHHENEQLLPCGTWQMTDKKF